MSQDPVGSPRWRSQLGRVGVWVSGGAIDEGPDEFARLVERLGYTGLWLGGGNADAGAFPRLESLLAATDHLVVATGILNIWAWEPAELARQARWLASTYPDRFLLGLGVSHAPLVEQLGRRYQQPYGAMVAYLDGLDGLDAVGGAAGAAGSAPPRVLAALGTRMLRLSAARASGAHPYLTTPEHTAAARVVLGPDSLLAPEQALVLEEDDGVARRRARAYLERYLRLPNYTANLRRLGWDAGEIGGGGSDALVDALVPHGTADAVAASIREHLRAGADHVCIQPLGEAGTIDRRALEVLAPVLTGDPSA